MADKYALDLNAAWAQVLREAGKDDITDVLRWEDAKLAWPAWREQLEQELSAGKYEPRPVQIVEMPKDGFVVRPLSLLHPRDRVVYQALVNVLAPYIDKALPPQVKSARLGKKGQPANQVEAWLGFQKAGRELHATGEYGFMLSTDVSSYFEYVRPEILCDDLEGLPGVNGEHVGLLRRFLKAVNRGNDVWGLPQGPEASSVLGNFYLLPVDRALELIDVQFLRYQDDVKVLGHDQATLRLALRDAIRVLRGRHLNVSVHKTKMLQGDEILNEFEDARKDAIQYALDLGLPNADGDLRALFDTAVGQDPVAARDVRFAIYRLGKNSDPHAVPWILDHLAEVPYLAALLARYLSGHMTTMPEIEERIRSYLQSAAENIYPWSEMHILRMLARAGSISDETRRAVWKILRDGNKEMYVREQAARCIGRHALIGDVGLLKTLFQQTSDFPLRRALLVAIVEAAATGQEKGFLHAVASADPQLEPTCTFLLSRAHLPDP